MQTGKMESCISNATNQLEGGHKYYLEDNQSGELSLEITGNWKANLNGCNVLNSKNNENKVIFRQIDLIDPFLKNYDRERTIGAKYLNSKFDFTKIIHDDVWTLEPEYDYFLSKVNVANIKKDTAEDRASSYLGRNCSFVNNEYQYEYQCQFTRNQTNNGNDNSNNWFADTKGSKLN